MPSPVDKYFKQVKESNPDYTDAQAWATAWSIYCKHKNPSSPSCHKDTADYLKGKSAMVLKVAASAARYAKDFPTEEALKTYLKEHPKADKSKHRVVETDKPESSGEGDSSEDPSTAEFLKGRPSNPKKPSKKAARVGIPGDAVLPPPKVPTLPNLTKDEREMERKFASAFESDPQKVAKDFYGIAEKNNFVFETDGAKALLHEWKRDDLPPDEKGKPMNPERAKSRSLYNTALHQTANAIAKRAFLSRLDEIEKMAGDKKKILVTSGGCAAGKGVGLAARPDLPKSVSATWDAAGEQNATENEWIIEECRKRGIKPTFMFVHSDPERAWKGAVKRAEGAGRMVDARVFADSYAEGAKNFDSFYKKHKDEADFVFAEVTFDSEGKPKVALGDDMPKSAKGLSADKIYKDSLTYIDAEKKADRVADHIYRGATAGRRIWGE